jgi:dipeptidyl aminopeptidase/acylaminoacyl peptidase
MSKFELIMEEHNGIPSLTLPNAETPEGLWPELVVNGVERIHNHAVSPDGRRVAFYRDRNNQSDLYTVEIGGETQPNWPNRLTFERPHVNWWEDEPPAWTPDSQHIVYGAYVDEVSQLFVVPAEGGQPRQLTELNADAAEPAVSPDGRWIAFSTWKGDATQIAMIDFDGGWVSGLTRGDDECSAPVWMPDGSHVLFCASPQHQLKQTDIYAVTPGGTPACLTPADGAQYWSPLPAPDGSCIALLCNRSGFDEVWLMSPDGAQLSQLTHINQDVEDFTWASDSKRIVLIGSEKGNDPLFLVNIASGETCQLRRPAGNHSTPRWVPGRNAFVAGFDSPSQPPDLHLCDGSTGESQPLTSSAPSVLKHYPFITPQHIEYAGHDGWLIPAFLYQPATMHDSPMPRRGYPAIVYPHGGPTAQYDLSWDPIRQYFVAKGYVILCPNYRGSTGYGRHFKEGNLLNWGVGDLHDCLAGADALAAMPAVNPQRMAIWGQSYGGYLTLLALSKDPQHRFRCGVCLYGDSHLKTSWAMGDHSGRQDVEWQMGLPSEHAAEYEAGSPLNYVKNIQAPLLIIHGERDQRVHPNESAQLVEALKRANVTYEYKTYPDEGHGFAQATNALDALGRIERFLDWHLM